MARKRLEIPYDESVAIPSTGKQLLTIRAESETIYVCPRLQGSDVRSLGNIP